MRLLSIKPLAITLFTALLIQPATADDMTDRLYAAFDLLEAMNMESQSEETIHRMVAVEVQNNPALLPYEHVLKKFYGKYLGFENTRYEMAEMYASAFSKNEIRQLIKFYNTDLGHKVMLKTPELAQRSTQMGFEAVQQNLYELQEMIRDESVRIKKLQKAANE